MRDGVPWTQTRNWKLRAGSAQGRRRFRKPKTSSLHLTPDKIFSEGILIVKILEAASLKLHTARPHSRASAYFSRRAATPKTPQHQLRTDASYPPAPRTERPPARWTPRVNRSFRKPWRLQWAQGSGCFRVQKRFGV